MVMEINRKGGAVGSKERDRVRERSRECGKLGNELGNIYIYISREREGVVSNGSRQRLAISPRVRVSFFFEVSFRPSDAYRAALGDGCGGKW